MEKEFIDVIVNLKVESKALTLLVDTILDSCELSMYGERLRINSDEKILTIVKAFFPEKYNNRLAELKARDGRLNYGRE